MTSRTANVKEPQSLQISRIIDSEINSVNSTKNANGAKISAGWVVRRVGKTVSVLNGNRRVQA